MATRETVDPSATVISMVPFEINEFKPGMTPGNFHLDMAPVDGFTTLLVKKCRHGVYLDENRPVLIVPTAPEEVAEAICFDYKKGQMGLKLEEAEPALFWVPGDFTDPSTHAQLKSQFAADFREAAEKQIRWFKVLVEQADDSWSKFHLRGIISLPQKIAAQRLKLNREWLLEGEVELALSECPVCFQKVHPKAILCRGCNNVLKPEEYKKHQFAMVAQK